MKIIFPSRKFLSGILSLFVFFSLASTAFFIFAEESNAQSCGNVSGGHCQSPGACPGMEHEIPDPVCTKNGKVCCGSVESPSTKYCGINGTCSSCNRCPPTTVYGCASVNSECFDYTFTTCCVGNLDSIPEGVTCHGDGVAGCYFGSCPGGTIKSPTLVCKTGETCCAYGVPPPPTCLSLGKECLPPSKCAANSVSDNAKGCDSLACCSPIPIPTSTCNGFCFTGASCGTGSKAGTGTCLDPAGKPDPTKTCCVSDTPPPPPPSKTCSASDFSGGLVQCGKGTNPMECDFTAFICLLQRIMNFLLFVMAIPLAAISFAFAGWMYMSAGEDTGKIGKAHEIFKSVAFGLCIALAAWLIVHAIVKGLGVSEVYNFLGN